MNIKIAMDVIRNRIIEKPIYAQIHVTRRCNYRCSFCAAWKSGSTGHEMKVDDYKLLAEYLDKLGVRLITLGGGEPLLRKDIVEIARCFPPSHFIVRIQTNGALLLENDLLDKLDDAGIKRYTVSLDSLDSHEMDAVRGKEEAWKKAVNVLRVLGKKYSFGHVVSSTAVTSRNIRQLPAILRFADTLGVAAALAPVNINPDRKDKEIQLAGDDVSMDPRNVEQGIVERSFIEVKNMKKRGAPIANSNFYLKQAMMYLRTGDKYWKCHAGTLYFMILPDGNVAPCNELPAVFNFLEKNPCSYMRSHEYIKKVKIMRRRCAGCIHDCWREPSYLLHPSILLERGLEYLKGQI